MALSVLTDVLVAAVGRFAQSSLLFPLAHAFPISERPSRLLALSVSLLASCAGAPCSLLLPALPSAFLRLAKLTPVVPSPDL